MESNTTLMVKNNQGWSIQAQFTDDELSFCILDPWSIECRSATIIFSEIHKEDLQRPIIELVEREFKRLSPHSKSFGFQVYKHNGFILVVFGGYGLQGGGRGKTTGIALGAGLTVGGAYCIGKNSNVGVLTLIGSILVSSGINGAIYAYKSKEEELSWNNYLLKLGQGAITGIISPAFSYFNSPSKSLGEGKKILCSLFNSTISGTISAAAHTFFQGEKIINNKKINEKIYYSALGSIVGSIGSQFTSIILNRVLNKVVDNVFKATLQSAFRSASEGVLSASGSKITENIINKKAWNDKLTFSALIALVIGAVSGAARGHENFYQNLLLLTSQKKHKYLAAEFQSIKWDKEFELLVKTIKIKKILIDFSNQLRILKTNHETSPNNSALNQVEKIIDNNPADFQEYIKEIESVKKCDDMWEKLVECLNRNFPNKMALETQRLPKEIPLENENDVLIPKYDLSELFSIFPPNPPVFVDEADWFELAKHVVLVHTIDLNPIVWALHSEYYDTPYENTPNLFIIHKAFTNDGEIGHYLKFKEKQFKDPLVIRPQIHWSWNQQVQSHVKSQWIESKIGIIEPLSTFEQPGKSLTFGIAPYDTMTLGCHILSEHSTVLIPKDIEKEAREHLSGFKGKITTYKDGSLLRREIHNQIKLQYPDTWHLVDPKSGKEIASEEYFINLNKGKPGYNIKTGCFKKTCLKKTNGQLIHLITDEGNNEEKIHVTAIKQAKNSGKFIGLHDDSTTAWLEDKDSFIALKSFTENPNSIVQNKNHCFIGYAKNYDNIKKLCILDAFHFYNVMNKCAIETKAGEIGDYILHEAFYADIVSVFFTLFPGSPIDFKRHEIALIISSKKKEWLNLLLSLSSNIDQEDEAITLQKKYCLSLQKAIDTIYIARKKIFVIPFIFDNILPKSMNDFLEGRLLQEEWSLVWNQGSDTDFDKKWPLTERERTFLTKFRELLSSKEEELLSILKLITEMSKTNTCLIEEKIKKMMYIQFSLELYLKEIYYNAD